MPNRTPTPSGDAACAGPRPTHRGAITVIEGCMFAGKTTTLFRRLGDHPPQVVLAFKHAIDRRYRPEAIVSHGGKSFPAVVIGSAEEIFARLGPQVRVVAVDEGHFFDEALIEVTNAIAARGLDVFVTTLDRDSWGRPFPVAERLRAAANHPVRLTAVCARCGAVGDRTQRLTPIVGGDLVGGPESYEPRCRLCWSPPPETPPH